MARDFPTVSFDVLFHVGSMDPADKARDFESHEGHGLSVTTEPDAWEEIAQLGGRPHWALKRTGNRFLDFHALTEAHRAEIATWAVREGWVEAVEAWEWRRFDDELASMVTGLSPSLDDALWSAGFEDCDGKSATGDVPEEAADSVRRTTSLAPTARLCERLRVSAAGKATVMIDDWVSIAYTEEVLELDGVWWEDRLDPPAYSAPRGVILPERLPCWSARQVGMRPPRW